MNAARAIAKLIVGETRFLPLGVAVVVGLAALVSDVAGGWWTHAGGFALLGGVAVVLLAAVARGAR
jgi:hypothetical protein